MKPSEPNEFGTFADADDAEAQYNLGRRYFHGEGVPRDAALAAECFFKSAKQGHAGAQTFLGFLCEKGQGIGLNECEAVRWYRKAAVLGVGLAQNNLGVMYAEGRGVPKDNVEAYKWLILADSQEHDLASGSLSILLPKMTREEVSEAEKRADDFGLLIRSISSLNDSSQSCQPNVQQESPSSSDADATHFVERLEVFEERVGIQIEAVYARIDSVQALWVNAELHASDTGKPKQDFSLLVAVYDKLGRLLATDIQSYYVESFTGLEIYSSNPLTLPSREISKIRLYPKPI